MRTNASATDAKKTASTTETGTGAIWIPPTATIGSGARADQHQAQREPAQLRKTPAWRSESRERNRRRSEMVCGHKRLEHFSLLPGWRRNSASCLVGRAQAAAPESFPSHNFRIAAASTKRRVPSGLGQFGTGLKTVAGRPESGRFRHNRGRFRVDSSSKLQ